MRVKIHRGTQEIGGSCIELEAAGKRLVLDLGRPMWAGRDERVPLPEVAGLAEADPSFAGLVISHGHLDHYGLTADLPGSVPLYMGEAAHRLLREASFFTGAAVPPSPCGFLRHRQPIEIGPFRVTPFLADHSAFDAYSLLVEAEGRRLFYTGDFRGHGRKAGIFEELLRAPPQEIDVLLMEGTNIRENVAVTDRGPSERDVEDAVTATCRATQGMALAVYSAQNIDRLVTFYRAALRSGRELVMDLYTASMARATGLASIPQADWEHVRVYLPRSQKRQVIRAQAFDRTNAVRARRIYPEELVARSGELLVSFRASMLRELTEVGCLAGAKAIWSLWPGYLREPSGVDLQARLEALGIPLVIHHSSGHAFPPDLARLVKAMKPGRVVPIHSMAGDRFADHFAGVERQGDGVWWAA